MLNCRIEELRKDFGMSQASLGKLLNVSQQAVAKWEKGIAEPDSNNIARISKLFNVSTDYLLGLTDNPTPSKKEYTEQDELNYELSKLTEEKRKKAESYIKFLKTEEEFSQELADFSLLNTAEPKKA